MPDQLLTLDAARDWVGDFEIAKGRPYARAVAGCVRAGNAIRASVRGTRPRPYRAWARLAEGHVGEARCTCPVGGGGKCKHVAAVLLAFLEHPSRFVALGDVDADLAARSQPELVALVKSLLHHSPELEPLLARPLPGFAAMPPEQKDYYHLALDAVRGANPHDDWAPHEIAAELREVVDYARAFGDEANAFGVIAQALREELGAAKAAEVATELPASVRDRLRVAEPPPEVVEPPF